MRKFLSLLLSFTLIAGNVFAEESLYIIEDFSGMLKSYVSPYLLKSNDAVQALNVRGDEEYGTLSKRPKMFLLSTAPTAAVKSLFRHYTSDDEKFTIATYSTKIDSISTTGAATNLYASATDAQRWSFVTYKDILIGMNGTDNAKKWDGKVLTTANTDAARTAGDLVADLGAPFAELNTGTDLDAASWYQYKVAFYNGSTYSFSNARSNPILTGSTVRNITLTDIPLGPSGTTARIIYRTSGQSSRANVLAQTSFFQVATISDNSTRTYNDAIADTTIETDPVPAWATVSAGTNVTPPKAKFPLIHQERLFLANDPSGTESGKSTVYFSDILNPDYFNYLVDYDLFRPDDGDEITFIKSVYGIMAVGKTRSISKYYTNSGSSTTWSISDPFSYTGCVAPYTAANAKSGIVYLGRYGIYAFNGQSSTLISDVVTDRIRDILETNIEEAVGTVQDNKYLLSYTSAESGSSVNNRVLILDLEHNAYYMDTKSIASFSSYDSSDDFGTLYSGSSGSDGDIYAHNNTSQRLAYRYKSQFEAGTTDSVYVGGTEKTPYLSLGTGETWAESTDAWEDSGSKTWLVDGFSGYWYSPIIEINASELTKLYWNETLGATGNITVAVRTGATEGAVNAASWSSEYTDPSGTDISALTANVYIQFRFYLTTSLWTETPMLYVFDGYSFRMTYKKEGTTEETSILSLYETGKLDLGSSELPKEIKEIQVFYSGTSGTLNFEYENNEGDSYNFDIDLSVEPDDDADDQYYGTNDEKVYVYIPSYEDSPTGRHWDFKFTEEGTEPWTVYRVFLRTEVTPYVTYK